MLRLLLGQPEYGTSRRSYVIPLNGDTRLPGQAVAYVVNVMVVLGRRGHCGNQMHVWVV